MKKIFCKAKKHTVREITKIKVKEYAVNGLCVAVSRLCEFKPEENLIIFSDPRGGSTWITEAIAQLPKTAVLWEPLHPSSAIKFNKLNFGWRQFIPEQETWNEAEMEFEKLFKGKILNNWTCYLSPSIRFLCADRMIIKFCRANAMIPWLTKRFNFTYDPIYLIRHPFAVVASQLNHGAWDANFNGFDIPNSPFNNLYTQHADFLLSLKTKEEALVATWCLTNLIPLRNTRNDKSWITVYYENLIRNPENEIERIFQRWGMEIPEKVGRQIKKASATTKDATFLDNIDKQCRKWKLFFDQHQISKMSAVLQYFEVKHYTTDIFPNIQ